MPTDIEDAWNELHDATPPGWYVGRPSYDEGRRVWEQYAFDPRERARAGVRTREWTARRRSWRSSASRPAASG